MVHKVLDSLRPKVKESQWLCLWSPLLQSQQHLELVVRPLELQSLIMSLSRQKLGLLTELSGLYSINCIYLFDKFVEGHCWALLIPSTHCICQKEWQPIQDLMCFAMLLSLSQQSNTMRGHQDQPLHSWGQLTKELTRSLIFGLGLSFKQII